MEFQLQAAGGHEIVSTHQKTNLQNELYSEESLKRAKAVFHALFKEKTMEPKEVMKSLEEILQKKREEWSLSLLRALWPSLLEHKEHPFLSKELEARWWNLAGYLLRPGFGYPLDDFRIKDFWKTRLLTKSQKKHPDTLLQEWIALRRVSGGLNQGQQNQLTSELEPLLLSKAGRLIEINKSQEYLYTETLRTLASMELIDMPMKLRLGDALIEKFLCKKALIVDFWAVGRVGARHLCYGSLSHIVSATKCSSWIEKLLTLPPSLELLFVFVQLARKTSLRHINISKNLVEKCLERYKDFPEFSKLSTKLSVETGLTDEEKNELLGDELPSGLFIE